MFHFVSGPDEGEKLTVKANPKKKLKYSENIPQVKLLFGYTTLEPEVKVTCKH